MIRSLILLLLAILAFAWPLQRDASSVVAPAPVRVELVFAGDVMQHMPQVHAARRGAGFDYGPVLAGVRPIFQRADLAVVNL